MEKSLLIIKSHKEKKKRKMPTWPLFVNFLQAVDAYESEEYKELSKLTREAAKNSTFTIMEGLDEASKLRRAIGK